MKLTIILMAPGFDAARYPVEINASTEMTKALLEAKSKYIQDSNYQIELETISHSIEIIGEENENEL